MSAFHQIIADQSADQPAILCIVCGISDISPDDGYSDTAIEVRI